MWFLLPVALAARPELASYVDDPAGRVRCHHDAQDDAALCAEVAAWAEEAWSVQVDGIGFRAPLPDQGLGGSDALDVYLTRQAGGAGQAWVDCDGGDPNCIDADPQDGFAGSSSYIVIDPRTDPDELAWFVFHEFQHTTQYATDYAEPFLSFWEATAVAAEHWTDPSWATSQDDLADWQATPWVSAVLQDGYFLDEQYGLWSWYEYGAVAWLFFLEDSLGDGSGAVARDLWRLAAQEGRGLEPDVLDAWDELSGDWRVSMLELALVRTRIGTPEAPASLAYGDERSQVAIEGELPAGGGRVSSATGVFPLGAMYVGLAAEEGVSYEIEVLSEAEVDWGLVVAGPEGDTLLDVVSGPVTVTPGAGDTVIGVVHLGWEGFDADFKLEAVPVVLSVTKAAQPVAELPVGCAVAPGRAGVIALLMAIFGVSLRRRQRS